MGAGPERTVAVIVPFITRWFFSTVIGSAVDALRERGYDVLLYHVGDADMRDDFFERMPLAGRVAGMLTVAMPLSENHTLALRASDVAMVSIGFPMPGSPSVRIDDEAAARSAVHHLLHLRHQQIAFIAGSGDDPRFEFASSSDRLRGCREALQKAGLTLDDDLLVSGPHSLEGGAAAMAELLTRAVLPTAVLAEYDELAIGALWALRRAGLTVPGDVSVIGMDDHEMAAMLDLTTVAQDVRGQGRIAAELLVAALTRETDRPDRSTDHGPDPARPAVHHRSGPEAGQTCGPPTSSASALGVVIIARVVSPAA